MTDVTRLIRAFARVRAKRRFQGPLSHLSFPHRPVRCQINFGSKSQAVKTLRPAHFVSPKPSALQRLRKGFLRSS